MKRRILMLVIALGAVPLGMGISVATATPSGPATNACAPVTAAYQRMVQSGHGNPDALFEHAVSVLCPL